MNEAEKYDAFIKRLEEIYPRAMRNVYCGISINEGWYHIVTLLVHHMHSHISWMRTQRAKALRKRRAGEDVDLPEKVHHIEIHQIKEKFGGLRFYYEGGDDYCSGLEAMAEAWANRTCEVCGEAGRQRSGGWIRTLCDKHEADHQEKNKKFSDEYYA